MERIRLPLSLHGSISYLPTRKPTMEGYNSLQHLVCTSETTDWDPHSDDFAEQEETTMTEDGGHILRKSFMPEQRLVWKLEILQRYDDGIQRINSQVSRVLSETNTTLNDDKFLSALRGAVNVSLIVISSAHGYQKVSASATSKCLNMVNVERLASTWNIGIEAAK